MSIKKRQTLLEKFFYILYNIRMKRVLLTISYDGTNFFGWQKQADKRTVQGEIEKAIEIVAGKNCEVFGSGRTDAGVHALAQMAHFDLPVDIPISRLADVLNSLLPGDIAIIKAEEVDKDFHARFSVKRKCYQYQVYVGKEKDPFMAHRMGWVKYPLDDQKMVEAGKLLVGKHNFKGFCSSATCTSDYERQIFSIDISHEGDFYYFDIEGSGFLYNMVRIIVGTLVDVGRGKLSLESVKEALAKGDRSKAGITMPAGGLYLKYAKY